MPPEIPKVKNKADTRYFEQEPTPSDIEESSNSSIPEQEIIAQEEFEQYVKDVWEQENLRLQRQGGETQGLDALQLHNKGDSEVALLQDAYEAYKVSFNRDRHKDRRRPRDRILRDERVAKEALELRKQGAFVGYTYRRPGTTLWEMQGNSREKKGNFQRPAVPSFSL